jgi:hypothetical protein
MRVRVELLSNFSAIPIMRVRVELIAKNPQSTIMQTISQRPVLKEIAK